MLYHYSAIYIDVLCVYGIVNEHQTNLHLLQIPDILFKQSLPALQYLLIISSVLLHKLLQSDQPLRPMLPQFIRRQMIHVSLRAVCVCDDEQGIPDVQMLVVQVVAYSSEVSG